VTPIDLLARDDRSGYGVAAALDMAGVVYRRITRVDDVDGRVLVVAGRTTPAIAALASHLPTVAFGAAPAGDRQVVEGPLSVALSASLWPEAVVACARRFGKDALRLPWIPLVVPERRLFVDTIEARAIDAHERTQPLVVRTGAAWWCLGDLGAAFASLLDESYRGAEKPPRGTRSFGAVHRLYYRLPEPFRRALQRTTYARLERALRHDPRASDYPIDATGWLLAELVAALVTRAAGPLLRVARWPAPYTAAAALTHDVEPTRFAYRRGLAALGARVAANGHPATIGLVAGAAKRHLRIADADWLRRADVLCHGLEHLGETLRGSRTDVAARLAAARAELARLLGRPPVGFRSPRLDRSRALLWAIDRAGFTYDSSYPDVDRETTSRFGAGVRVNVPFRPPVVTLGGRVRPSRFLELPIAAPDCIQPLFAGDDVRALRDAVAAKIDYVCATGGLYVGIVHGGVFGPADAARRGEHLDFVAGRLRRPDVWLASAREIACWWRARATLRFRLLDDGVEVTNGGTETIGGVRLLAGADARSVELPPLAPGARAHVALTAHDPREARREA
jgi:hypothetical protein